MRMRRAAPIESLESRRLLSGLPVHSGLNPTDLVNADGTLLFANDDQSHGTEIWKSDGTQQGTMLLKDIRSGAESSVSAYSTDDEIVPELLTVSGTTYFAADDGVHGIELWKTRGSTATTSLVADLFPGSVASRPFGFRAYGNSAVFVAEPYYNESQLWKTDGTEDGTVPLVPPSLDVWQPTVVGNTIYFINDTTSSHDELWESNGQPGGAKRLLDPFDIGNLYSYNGHLYVYYASLSRFDPASSKLISVFNPPNLQRVFPIGSVGGKLLFSALYDRVADGYAPLELWATDGTPNGTTRLWNGKMIDGWPYDLTPFQFTRVGGNTLYFDVPASISLFPISGSGQIELWKTDGTSGGTKQVKVGGFQNAQSLSNFTDYNGTLYFVDVAKLWKSDGTATGTTPVADLPFDGTPGPYSVAARRLTAINGRLFFVGVDPTHVGEASLWTYTPGGQMLRLRTVPAKLSVDRGALNVLGGYGNDTIRVNANAQTGDITVYWNDVPSQTFKQASVTKVVITANSGDDTVILTGPVPHASVSGDEGNDSLVGGTGDDSLDAGSGSDVLRGGAGNDVLQGGDGDDTLDGGAGDDALYGANGNDTADYSTRSDHLIISLDDRRHDGGSGERDNVSSDIENVTAGGGNDLIIGSSDNNVLLGNAGNDTLLGMLGDDQLNGGDGNDSLSGDVGNDTLTGGQGNDTLDAGYGNDLLVSNDDNGARDYLYGGKGMDSARVDSRDRRSLIEQLLS
jgi:ELWxxDGT repeat protein